MSDSKAIPTAYNGIQFRSRIEAKWAAMFDLLEWPWEYEPIDLDGYIPDFVLSFKQPMIVEVKSYLGSPFDWCNPRHEAAVDLEKIARSGWRGEGLFVGASMHSDANSMGSTDYGRHGPINPGLLFDCHETSAQTGQMYAEAFGFKACCGGPVDVVGIFSCRRCGDHDKGPTLMDSEKVVALWREATNRVQWKTSNATHRKRQRANNTPIPRRNTATSVSCDYERPAASNLPLDEVAAFFGNFSFEDDE